MEFEQLSILYGNSRDEMHGELQDAVRNGLVLASGRAYTFLHDRVQEAAYSSIPEAERAAAHLRIGRLLAARTAPDGIEDSVFEIVSQLNRGAHLIEQDEERARVAELNLIAGRRAKAAVAHAAALTYLVAGLSLLSEDDWQRRYRLVFELELNRAHCEFLTAGDRAGRRAAGLAGRARDGPCRSCVRHPHPDRAIHRAGADAPRRRDLPRLPAAARRRLDCLSQRRNRAGRARAPAPAHRRSRDRELHPSAANGGSGQCAG